MVPTWKVTKAKAGLLAMRQVIDGNEVMTGWECARGKFIEKKVNGKIVPSVETTYDEAKAEIKEKHEHKSGWNPKF